MFQKQLKIGLMEKRNIASSGESDAAYYLGIRRRIYAELTLFFKLPGGLYPVNPVFCETGSLGSILVSARAHWRYFLVCAGLVSWRLAVHHSGRRGTVEGMAMPI